ncbi:MAG: ARC6/PARC6 family protein, partial [Holophagales bacterium]|nr:ARC6/PARC6 family protein [Holophagales bacterium]
VFLSVVLFLGLSAGLTACSPGTPPEEVDRSEIETFLEGYLPTLGRAYSEGDPSLLEGLAVPKEQARIELRIEELAVQGQVYEPTFLEVTVEDVSVWNYSNAFASTLEVWDVRAYTTGSRMLVNESVGQRSRVKYQLKRKDDSWVVLFRELEQTFDS